MPQKLQVILTSNENQLTEYIGGLTPAVAYGGQMSNFMKDNSQNLYTAIERLIASLALSLNVGKNIEPHQLAPLARSIYKKYFFYSLDELALVLRMGKQGDLIEGKDGKLYNKLDEDDIMAWFKIYDNRYRMAIVENKRGQDNMKMEKDNTNTIFSALGGELGINKLKEDLKDPKEDEYKAMREKYFQSKKESNE